MKYINILNFVLLFALFAACDSGKTSTPKLSKQDLLNNIASAEKDLYPGGDKFTFDSKKALNLVQSYEAFVTANPTDNASADYLFKSAEIYRSLKDFKKSNECYEKIISQFPSYEKAAHSLFLMGFCYENDLKQLDKAKALYQKFLNQYPEHELRDDVEFSLNNIGKSPEEIIKQFEQNNKDKKPEA